MKSDEVGRPSLKARGMDVCGAGVALPPPLQKDAPASIRRVHRHR
jgi:hypothetical protein